MQKKTLWIILGAIGGGVVLCGGCCGVGALIAVPKIRAAADRTVSVNQLKAVVLAMHAHFDVHKRMPASVAELQPHLQDSPEVLDRIRKREIEVVWGALPFNAQPGGSSSVIIAWDTKIFTGNMHNAAFMDGVVQALDEATFLKTPKAATK